MNSLNTDFDSSFRLLRKVLVLFVCTFCFGWSQVTQAAGVVYSSGNVSNTNASLGTGGSTVMTVTVDLNMPRYYGLGVYDVNGVQANSLFTNGASTFLQPTFNVNQTAGVLLVNEGNLRSKLALDGINSVPDSVIIANAVIAPNSIRTNDYLIKGIFYKSTTDAFITGLNATTITMTGGVGLAPQIGFRRVVGLPGTNTFTATNTPGGSQTIPRTRFNASGYSRFVISGDLDESTVNNTTRGNWTGNMTISLLAL